MSKLNTTVVAYIQTKDQTLLTSILEQSKAILRVFFSRKQEGTNTFIGNTFIDDVAWEFLTRVMQGSVQTVPIIALFNLAERLTSPTVYGPRSYGANHDTTVIESPKKLPEVIEAVAALLSYFPEQCAAMRKFMGDADEYFIAAVHGYYIRRSNQEVTNTGLSLRTDLAKVVFLTRLLQHSKPLLALLTMFRHPEDFLGFCDIAGGCTITIPEGEQVRKWLQETIGLDKALASPTAVLSPQQKETLISLVEYIQPLDESDMKAQPLSDYLQHSLSNIWDRYTELFAQAHTAMKNAGTSYRQDMRLLDMLKTLHNEVVAQMKLLSTLQESSEQSIDNKSE